MENITEFLTKKIESLIGPLGFELVNLEIQNHRIKTLRVFIDHASGTPKATAQESIGIEDCVAATDALNEALDKTPEVEAFFKGNYELEVSSPGVDRPLLKASDYKRFVDRDVTIRLTRPLTVEESQNADYVKKHPKQKDFVGTLKDFEERTVVLAVKPDDGTQKIHKIASKKPKKKNENLPVIKIPFELVSKCNLYPVFDFSE